MIEFSDFYSCELLWKTYISEGKVVTKLRKLKRKTPILANTEGQTGSSSIVWIELPKSGTIFITESMFYLVKLFRVFVHSWDKMTLG